MSRGYNYAALLGGFVRDPDVKYTPDGKAVARFTLACGYSRKQSDGTYKDEADYPQCVAFGHVANAVAKYCKKGSQVYVVGKIKTGSYEAKDGSGRKFTSDVAVNEIRFVGGKKDGENNANTQQKPSNGSSNYTAENANWDFNDASEDMPPDFFDYGKSDEPDLDIPF
jgi:single-strand DNA-binding protein